MGIMNVSERVNVLLDAKSSLICDRFESVSEECFICSLDWSLCLSVPCIFRLNLLLCVFREIRYSVECTEQRFPIILSILSLICDLMIGIVSVSLQYCIDRIYLIVYIRNIEVLRSV